MPLTPRQRQHLRGLGHHLDPVMMVGQAGVSEAVVAKAHAELHHHELIKVRAGGSADDDAQQIGEALAQACDAELVQVIGHVALLYRRRPKKPDIQLPKP